MLKINIKMLFLIFFVSISSNLHSQSPSSYYLTVKATAYCPCKLCCGKWSDNKTKTNTDAYLAGVAVDPKIIPLGSHIDIPGYKRGPNKNGSWILCDDIGGAIKGKEIDVRFKTHREALKWGVRTIKIRVHVR